MIHGREAQDPGVLEYQRHLGYQEAIARAGLSVDPSIVVPGAYTIEGGARAMRELLSSAEPPTAVFAFSDEMASGALRVMREQKLTPGRDIAIIGFDGHATSALLDLTTISVPFEDIGRITTRRLLDQLDGVTADQSAVTVLPTTLSVRASTG